MPCFYPSSFRLGCWPLPLPFAPYRPDLPTIDRVVIKTPMTAGMTPQHAVLAHTPMKRLGPRPRPSETSRSCHTRRCGGRYRPCVQPLAHVRVLPNIRQTALEDGHLLDRYKNLWLNEA